MYLNTLLEVRDLRVYFYTYAGVVRAVDGVSFSVRKGEILCIVGETGCGKSVMSRALTRMVKPPGRIVSGEVLFDGIDLLKLPEKELKKIRGREISYVYQDPGSVLDPLYTAGFHVAETVLTHNSSMKFNEVWGKAIRIFREVLIPDPEAKAKSYPHELSGGMKQRVVIATAIANTPKLIIADEPTTALDVTVQAQVMELIRSLKNKYNSSVMLITHNLGVVAEVCDRVIVMYAGKIVEVALVEELFTNPLHPYTQGLLEAVPNPLRKVERLRSIHGSVPNMIDLPEGCRFNPRCPHKLQLCNKEPELVEYSKDHLVSCWLYKR
ncbi:MAG: ABC transporter ATP-binding protein [Desulfurococcaceae archaeon]|nr:ABC transporter ATP-binding protein [Sulfolobales archaeon]MDW8169991.1 ABC transporter ATP-binding protein [Desulfurococcaceae archaeon]